MKFLEKIHCFDYIGFIKKSWNTSANLILFVYVLSIFSIVLTSQSYRYSNAVNDEQFNITNYLITYERFVTKLSMLHIVDPLLTQGILGVSTTTPFQDVYRSYLIATYFEGDINKEAATVNNPKELNNKIKLEELKKWTDKVEIGKKEVSKYQKILNTLFFVNNMVQILLTIIAFRLGQLSLEKKSF